MEITKTHRVAGGMLNYCRHASAATGTTMSFSVFTPDGPGPFPVLLWLSGLTCTEDNFTTKAGAYPSASKAGVMVVAPDTSPRGEGVADDPSYDLGQGAGFYLDATEAPWAPHFRMESYVVDDLLTTIGDNFPADLKRVGVSGHSMGGHGALTLALRHPDRFRSVSALAPIASPTRCPWGVKAFNAYLGADRSKWAEHDAAMMIGAGAAKGRFDDVLVDVGLSDPFLEEQLKPNLLEETCRMAGQPLSIRRREGYDHSYFFVATFIQEHVAWHAARLV
ncbi:MAG: S-formylglutathione hydrolase [Alphaproteobacteria bacterium]|nr:S-formylglutathione hydrolase [Alphaproteobacteria bacterium]